MWFDIYFNSPISRVYNFYTLPPAYLILTFQFDVGAFSLFYLILLLAIKWSTLNVSICIFILSIIIYWRMPFIILSFISSVSMVDISSVSWMWTTTKSLPIPYILVFAPELTLTIVLLGSFSKHLAIIGPIVLDSNLSLFLLYSTFVTMKTI